MVLCCCDDVFSLLVAEFKEEKQKKFKHDLSIKVLLLLLSLFFEARSHSGLVTIPLPFILKCQENRYKSPVLAHLVSSLIRFVFNKSGFPCQTGLELTL